MTAARVSHLRCSHGLRWHLACLDCQKDAAYNGAQARQLREAQVLLDRRREGQDFPDAMVSHALRLIGESDRRKTFSSTSFNTRSYP